MIASLRAAALLKGYRGSPPLDGAALKDVLLRVSALVSSCPEIQELDINPLTMRTRGPRLSTFASGSPLCIRRRRRGESRTSRGSNVSLDSEHWNR